MKNEIRTIISELIKKTESGDLKWKKTPRDNYLTCEIEGQHIFVYPVQSYRVHDSIVITLRITYAGKIIEELSDLELEYLEPSDNKDKDRILDLYIAARRSTVNAFKVFDSIHSALKQ